MAQLSLAQTQAVINYLATTNTRQSLQDDLLDQLCCEIEAKMEAGSSFDTALRLVTQNWTPRKIRSIDQSITFTTKTKPMMTRILAFSLFLTGLYLLAPAKNDPEITRLDLPSVSIDPATDIGALHLALPTFAPPKACPLAGMELDEAYSTYGMRIHPITKKHTLHRGLDFISPVGTPVLATAAGKVIASGTDGKYGIRIIIEHADEYSTLYAHLSAVDVQEGDEVKLGQQIGQVGNTGVSTGPHLHYEVRKENEPVNPLAQL